LHYLSANGNKKCTIRVQIESVGYAEPVQLVTKGTC